MSDDVELQIAETEDREHTLAEQEAAVYDQLAQKGLLQLWNRIKTGLHAEKFFASKTGKHVLDRLMQIVVDAQTEWMTAPDPTTPEIIECHRRASAASLAIHMLDEIVNDFPEARRDLEQIELEMGE